MPYGSAPGEAAADAEPLTEQNASATPLVPSAPGAAGAAPPLAIPGIPLDRPELHVGAAFVGGLVLARILKRIAG